MPIRGDSQDRKSPLRRRYREGDPRQFLDERMLELLDQLDQIPYERPALGPVEQA